MSEEEKQYLFNFSFFKIDPKWRWMADLAKEESARELENVLAIYLSKQEHIQHWD